MHALDFKLEEGIKGQYRVVAFAGLMETPLTDWYANAQAALDEFGAAQRRLEHIEDRIIDLERINKERANEKAARVPKG